MQIKAWRSVLKKKEKSTQHPCVASFLFSGVCNKTKVFVKMFDYIHVNALPLILIHKWA